MSYVCKDCDVVHSSDPGAVQVFHGVSNPRLGDTQQIFAAVFSTQRFVLLSQETETWTEAEQREHADAFLFLRLKCSLLDAQVSVCQEELSHSSTLEGSIRPATSSSELI